MNSSNLFPLSFPMNNVGIFKSFLPPPLINIIFSGSSSMLSIIMKKFPPHASAFMAFSMNEHSPLSASIIEIGGCVAPSSICSGNSDLKG